MVDFDFPRLDELDTVLDGYVNSVGIKYTSPNNEVDKYINMSRIELCKYTREELGEIAYLLDAFAFHLQKELNKEQTRVNWAASNIALEVAKLAQQYKGYSYEERSKQAIDEHEGLRKLEKIRIYAQSRLDRLSYLPAKLNKMSDSLQQLQQSKKREI